MFIWLIVYQQGFVLHYLKQGENDDAYIEQIVWQYNNEIYVDKLKKHGN